MGQKRRERTKFWLCRAYGLIICVCGGAGGGGVYMEKNKIHKKQSEGMPLRRDLETWKDLASERKEGIL